MESVKDLARAAEKGKAPAASVDALSLADLRKELRSFGATLSECAARLTPPFRALHSVGSLVCAHGMGTLTAWVCCMRLAWLRVDDQAGKACRDETAPAWQLHQQAKA